MHATQTLPTMDGPAPLSMREQLSLTSLEADVERALARGGDPEDGVLHACAEAIASYLQAPAVRVWTLDEERAILVPRARAGACGSPPAGDGPVPVGQRLIGQIAAARRPRFLEPWREQDAGEGGPAAACPDGEGGVAAFAGYPLVAGDRLEGVLALWARRRLSGATRAALGSIAGVIARGLEARRTQAALRQSEERFRAFMDNTPAVAFLEDADGRMLWVNRPFELAFGQRLEDIRGRTDAERWPPEIARRLTAIHQQVLAGGRAEQVLETLPSPAGERSWLSLKFPFDDAAGRRFLGCVAIDLTEQRRAEEERERSLSALRATLESTADGILAVDTEGRVVAYNRRFGEMWHIPESMLAAGDNEQMLLLIKDRLADPEKVLEKIRPASGTTACDLVEFKDGTLLERYAVPQYLGGKIIGDVVSYRDVTAARRAEADLRESEARYRLLFESNPQPMWVYDAETLAFLAVNAAACEHYGFTRDDFLGMTLADLQVPEDRADLLERLARSQDPAGRQRPWQHRRQDGSTIAVEILAHGLTLGGRPARLALVTDVSERQRLEEHLRQTQKMEAIGLLAGGVAHDFNNLLTVISGYASLVARALPAASRMRSHVGEVLRAAERAASLTHQLLAFSRQQVMQPRVLDLNALLDEMRGLLRRIIREDIALVFAPDAQAGHVLADPTQIEQVVMNLVVNARDAMPHGGKLTLTTAGARLSGGEGGREFSVETGNYVRLTVSDTGIGMDAATLSRVFEPFFTTKEKGRGTGLGLSTVYGVVKQSGGYVWLASEPGQGCSVHVYLPRIEQPPDGEALGAPPETAAVPAAGETVIVAEDEGAVRSLVVKVLSEAGYRVLPAASGREALDLCRRRKGRVHLLLTDVVMPEMNGPELARQVTEIHPEAKVLYMSGYTDKAMADPALDLDLVLLEKPFVPADLARRVREVLDAPGAHSAAR